MNNFIGFVLAAGKGTRIQKFTDTPKVLLDLNGKTLVQYGLDLLASLKIDPIVVLSYKKEEIIKKLGDRYLYAQQKGNPGTGGAIMAALDSFLLNEGEFNNITSVVVLQGDDTAFLRKETIKSLLEQHQKSKSVITLLTTKKINSTGFGRIIRDEQGEFRSIVEEKNANEEQKKVTEINTGLWCFDLDWLKKNISKITPNKLTKEFYATELIEIAVKSNKQVETFTCNEDEFFGINNEEQYKKAIIRKTL